MRSCASRLALESRFYISVDESRETQNASGIVPQDASEFACHGTQQGLAVFPVNTLDPPHDLEFVRRCIYG